MSISTPNTLDVVTILHILRAERPEAMDKAYVDAAPWEKGACDMFNTVVLRFARNLFPGADELHITCRAEFTRQCTRS